MKILITGTAGFIGMHVAHYFLKEGNIVIGIDNLNSYYSVQLKKDRNNYLKKYNEYHFHLCDLENTQKVDQIFDKYKPDVVVNLAAQAGVRYSIENPHAYINSNILGFLNVLEYCRKYKVPKIVYASSSNVYGASTKNIYKESDIVNKPLSMYGVTKICSELMAYSFSYLYNIQTIGLRFFSVYGPWGRPDMALFIFTKAIMENKPIHIYNNGNMQRDFTYIDDIVKGIVSCVNHDSLDLYEIFNLGNHRCENLMDFITILEENLQQKAQKIFEPMQPGDFKCSYSDISKAQEKLKFEPITTIKEGIPKFVAWYKEYYQSTTT